VAMASYGATSLTTLLQMAAHGLGLTLIPEMAIEPERTMRNLEIVPFREPMPSRTICLAWRRNSMRHEECVEMARIVRSLRARLVPKTARTGLCDRSGRRPVRRRPRPPAGDETGLRAQDHAALQHFEMVGAQGRSGRGDIGEDAGRTGCRRAFGRAQALDD